MIAAATPRRAAALTAAVLLAAAIRGLLQPIGDLAAAIGFVMAIVGVLAIFGTPHTLPTLPRARKHVGRSPNGGGTFVPAFPPPSPSPASGGGTFLSTLSRGGGGTFLSTLSRGSGGTFVRGTLAAFAGVTTGFVVLLPIIGAGASGRALTGFWGWGAAVVVIATLEEVVIRGRLQPAWTAEGGPIVGLLASAAVFALIHLPRFGVGALPLDFAVGLALAGLRAVTGRVAPCVIAHVIADWGAWFWL